MKTILSIFIILLFAVQGWALTTFYVDPDATSTYDGSAANPWRGLDDGDSNEDEMDAIDTALASGDVIVYFSARDAGSDVDEETTVPIQPIRTNGSSNRLTLDGMSYYNTNDSSPSWSAYSGTSRFKVTSGIYPFDGHKNDGGPDGTPRDYITVRGFKIVSGDGDSGGFALCLGGSHLIVEYNEVWGVVGHNAPLVYFPYSSVNIAIGPQTDITYRYNTFHDSYGEALYIGGDGDTSTSSHSYIYVYENNIYSPGSLGGEGNCIDFKDELSYVYVYNNKCTDAEDHGIVGLSFDHIYIYNNFVDTPKYTGIQLNTNIGTGGSGGSYIYNNIVFDSETEDFSGIAIGTAGAGDAVSNVYVYNNTLDGNSVGINVSATTTNLITNVSICNNNSTNSAKYGMKLYNTVAPTYLNNDVWNSATADYNGIASQTGSNGNISVDPLYTNDDGDDFTLTSLSPVIGAGSDLGNGLQYGLDPTSTWPGTVRPLDQDNYGDWEIGAYVYVGSSISTGGTNLITVGGTNSITVLP